MNCPKCKSQDMQRDGKVKSKQRVYCINCHYHFTVEKKPPPLKSGHHIKVVELDELHTLGCFSIFCKRNLSI
jgi:transposase-like protein